MNRRRFLQALTTGVAGAFVLDPEQLLWVPGRTSYFFVQQPVRRLTLAQLVAVTYERIIRERPDYRDSWGDAALLRCLEERGAVRCIDVAS